MQDSLSALRCHLKRKYPHYKLFLECESQSSEQELAFTEQLSAPVIYAYIRWVVTKAKKLGCKRLYFLARDGYVLYHAAKIFCEHQQIQIECRYLYCSRIALRIPSFFLSFDEACEFIFSGGYRITPYLFLKRILLTKSERQLIYDSIHFPIQNEHQELSYTEQKVFSDQLRQTPVFQKILMEKSKAAFQTASGYFKQEGLFDGEPIFLVDTGWLGSMQAILKKLCEANGCYSPLTGFYFGLYSHPEKENGGNYYSYYFTPSSSPFLKAKFNNNILECICTAPHGMTLGYEESETQYRPILKAYSENSQQLMQIKVLKRYLVRICKTPDSELFTEQELFGITKRILQFTMYTPSLKVAEYYGKILFCDDASESYLNTLAQKVSSKQMHRYLIWNRVYYKFLKKDLSSNQKDDLFWPYGSIVLSKLRPLFWYRFHLLLWELLRQLLKKY